MYIHIYLCIHFISYLLYIEFYYFRYIHCLGVGRSMTYPFITFGIEILELILFLRMAESGENKLYYGLQTLSC